MVALAFLMPAAATAYLSSLIVYAIPSEPWKNCFRDEGRYQANDRHEAAKMTASSKAKSVLFFSKEGRFPRSVSHDSGSPAV